MSSLREGEVWGEITEASPNRLLEHEGFGCNTRGTRTSLTTSKEDKPKEQWRPEPKTAGFGISKPKANGTASLGASRTPIPLYVDKEAYAEKSPHGRLIIAPPATLCAGPRPSTGLRTASRAVTPSGEGSTYEWKPGPIYVDEKIGKSTYLPRPTPIWSKTASLRGGMSAVQDYETEAFTLEGEVRSARTGPRGTDSHASELQEVRASTPVSKRHVWTDEELEGVWEEYHGPRISRRTVRGNRATLLGRRRGGRRRSRTS